MDIQADEIAPLIQDDPTRDTAAEPSLLQSRLKASQAAQRESKMPLAQCIRLYRKAIVFSMIISGCIIMEGYDVALLQAMFAFRPFQERYGQRQPGGSYELSARWQAGLANGAAVGEILGLFANGIISERIGYRKTVLYSLLLLSCFIFILVLVPGVEVLLVGEVLCGIPWGVFRTLTTVYAAEVCPVQLRGYLTTYVNLCYVIGTLLAQGVLRAFLFEMESRENGKMASDWAYRIPFAMQWLWPLPIAIGVWFAPESPWWLIRQGRTGDAKKAVEQLISREADPEFDVDGVVSMMHYTHEFELYGLKGEEERASYLDCFKGIDLRRTEITCMVYAIQNLSGCAFMGYSTYFFEQAGLDSAQAFNMAMVQYSLGAIGTIVSWFLIKNYGRRSLYLGDLVGQMGFLFLTGPLGTIPPSSWGNWAIATMMICFTGVYDMTVGPVCYALVPEMPSSRLRTHTVVLGRNLYNVINILMNMAIPYMLNPTAWNWKAKAGFFYAALCAVCIAWAFFRLPESKDRTYAELDVLFEQKVAAREFKNTPVALFQAGMVIERRDGKKVV